jgi:uncharacterized protein
MSTIPGLVIGVADLLRHPASRRPITIDVRSPEIDVGDASVPNGSSVVVEGDLESLAGGIVVHATATAPWRAMCRRCLGPAEGELVASLTEVFSGRGYEGDDGEEVHPIKADAIDLGPSVHDALALELPLAPLCRADCAGLCPTCGTDLNQGRCDCRTESIDPRWAALDVLREPRGR